MAHEVDKGLEDVPVSSYLDLYCVGAKELNIGIGMLKERNHKAPSFRTFLDFEKFTL